MKKNVKFLFLIILVFLFLCVPSILEHFNFECILLKYTHLYCPACGITRMLESIVKFKFYQAFRYNPYLFILIILGIIYATIYFVLPQEKTINITNKIYIIIIISAIIFTILRNIPLFSFLLPTVVN